VSDVFFKMRQEIGELYKVVTVKGISANEKRSDDVISRTSSLLKQDGAALVKLLNLRSARSTP